MIALREFSSYFARNRVHIAVSIDALECFNVAFGRIFSTFEQGPPCISELAGIFEKGKLPYLTPEVFTTSPRGASVSTYIT
jgi:hypothetical protein